MTDEIVLPTVCGDDLSALPRVSWLSLPRDYDSVMVYHTDVTHDACDFKLMVVVGCNEGEPVALLSTRCDVLLFQAHDPGDKVAIEVMGPRYVHYWRRGGGRVRVHQLLGDVEIELIPG